MPRGGGGGFGGAWGKGQVGAEPSRQVPEGNRLGEGAGSAAVTAPPPSPPRTLPDALFFLLIRFFFGLAPWFPLWSCGSFPVSAVSLLLLPFGPPEVSRCWHLAGSPTPYQRRLGTHRRPFAQTAPPPLLRAWRSRAGWSHSSARLPSLRSGAGGGAMGLQGAPRVAGRAVLGAEHAPPPPPRKVQTAWPPGGRTGARNSPGLPLRGLFNSLSL